MIPARLRDEIETWMREGRYGHLQVNFANGKIVNVNRVESIRMDIIIPTFSGSNTTVSGNALPENGR